jgi:hypothetical protein
MSPDSNSSLEKDRESDEESVVSTRQPTIADDTESINIPVKKRCRNFVLKISLVLIL